MNKRRLVRLLAMENPEWWGWHADRVSRAEQDRHRTKAGGFSRLQLEAWGVPWPGPKGWRDVLAGKFDTP